MIWVRRGIACGFAMIAAHVYAFTRNIMVTGYWPNTNEMVRQFSTNPAQNPDGWRGGNWEGRGYNIYSFFPEFPAGTFPVGVGDFTVDYQDTSSDWWRIVAEVNPVAIVTFSRGAAGRLWEVEWRQRNLVTWANDYVAPFQPTPSPPDSTYPANGIRFSTLPMDDIVAAVNGAGLNLNAFVDRTDFGGGFLSEFIAYHGTWYQDIHKSANDPYRCVMSGHVHVGTTVDTPSATAASEVTLREVIRAVDAVVPEPSALTAFGVAGFLMLRMRRRKNT